MGIAIKNSLYGYFKFKELDGEEPLSRGMVKRFLVSIRGRGKELRVVF